jgi:Tfp pilus assembly protein PilF
MRPTLIRWTFPALLLLVLPSSAPAQNQRHEELKAQAADAYAARDFEQALSLAEEVLSEAPDDHRAWYFRASAKVEMGTAFNQTELLREGIEDARESIRLGGDENPEYYFPYLFGMTNLSKLENRANHAEVAIEIVDAELAERPALTADQRANFLYQRARANNQLAQTDAAISDLDRALQTVPNHLPSLLLKCEVAAKTGNHELASASYQQAAEMYPDNPIVQNNFGLYLFEHGNFDEAIDRFSRAVEADETYFMGYTNRAYVTLMQGNAVEAEVDFTRSLELNPQQPVAYRFRGEAHLRQSETAEAVADYRQVAELQPQSSDAHAELGFALLFAGEADEARAELEQALELNNGLQFLNPWLCLAIIEGSSPDDARSALQATLDKPVEQRQWFDMTTLYLLGEINDGELLAAVNPNDEAVTNSQQCEAYFFIGRRLQSQGMTEEATAFFEQALEVGTPRLTAYRGALQQR